MKTDYESLGLNEKRSDIFNYDLTIEKLSSVEYDSPLIGMDGISDEHFIPDDERVLAFIENSAVTNCYKNSIPVPSFEKAGPRKKLFFAPGETVSAIVTCGGICPGLNAVIRGIVTMNYYRYNNQRTYGIGYGYAGFMKELGHQITLLTPEVVDSIQLRGGTIIGTSRGPQPAEKIVDRLEELGVNILYTIGGDGTQKGAMTILDEIKKRGLEISVIGIPKTIDNDISYIDKSFGMETAFSEACGAIDSASKEARSVYNGIGIVKLMGRDSGFIAANATLATTQVDFCLIPEMDFNLEGEKGILREIAKKLTRKRHCVIVVAEGAGQKYMLDPENIKKDASGNTKLGDIGLFLKEKTDEYLNRLNLKHSIKYIDPSYIIRSCGPTPNDAIFCNQLAQMAVHAGMSGRTGMIIGYYNGQFTHIPMKLATSKRKKIDLSGQLWLSVLEATGQPSSF